MLFDPELLGDYSNYLTTIPLDPSKWKPIKDKIFQVTLSTEKETLPDFRIALELLH